MTPDDSPEKMTVTEYTGLISLISGMLAAMETRILERLTDNSRLAAERWARHDEDSKRVLADWDARFGRLEAKVEEHHHAAELEHVTWDARISPLRNTATLIAKNWKTLLLALFAALGFIAISADIVARYLGFPT